MSQNLFPVSLPALADARCVIHCPEQVVVHVYRNSDNLTTIVDVYDNDEIALEGRFDDEHPPQQWGSENEHHYFDLADWREEVGQGSCTRGYHDWVESNVEEKQFELDKLEVLFEVQGDRNPDLADEIDELRAILDPDYRDELPDDPLEDINEHGTH